MLSVDVVAVCTSDLLRKELELEDAQVILGHVNNDAIRFHVFVWNCSQRIKEVPVIIRRDMWLNWWGVGVSSFTDFQLKTIIIKC